MTTLMSWSCAQSGCGQSWGSYHLAVPIACTAALMSASAVVGLVFVLCSTSVKRTWKRGFALFVSTMTGTPQSYPAGICACAMNAPKSCGSKPANVPFAGIMWRACCTSRCSSDLATSKLRLLWLHLVEMQLSLLMSFRSCKWSRKGQQTTQSRPSLAVLIAG